jgi:hypothetical protein
MDRPIPSPTPNVVRGGAVRSVKATTAAPRRRKYSPPKIALLLFTLFTLSMAGIRGCTEEEVQVAAPVEEAPRVVDCKTYPFKHYSKHLKDRLPEYKARSLQAGIPAIPNVQALEQRMTTRDPGLVHVVTTDAFHVAEMSHGRPYLTPKAHAMLLKIAADFQERIKGTDLEGARLKVTSLLRTRKDQQDLGRSNVNATRDADAPHTHGTSMDISYMKFVSSDGGQLDLLGCQQVFLAETLAEVIVDLKKKDPLLFATREVKQACYHLTVCH